MPEGYANFSQTLLFQCRPQDIFDTLTDARMMGGFSRSPATSEAKEGGRFSMFGGSVEGTYKQFKPNERLVMDWRMKEWEERHYSTVTIDFKAPEYGQTIMHLVQREIPISDRYGHRDVPEKVEAGWNNHYWQNIAKICGLSYQVYDEDDDE